MADLPSQQLLFFTWLTRSANICLCHLCNLLCLLLLLAPFGRSALDSINWILNIIQSAFPKAFHLCFYWKNLSSISYNLILLCPYALLCTPVRDTIASCTSLMTGNRNCSECSAGCSTSTFSGSSSSMMPKSCISPASSEPQNGCKHRSRET